MNRGILSGIVIGAGLCSAAYLVASQLKPAPPPPPRSAKMRVYELQYQRPHSPVADFEAVPDPLAGMAPSQGLARLATSCKVSEYKMDSIDDGGFRLNPSATLYIDPTKLSDEAFNCLNARVRPPYLSLQVFERCRSLLDKNPANPPCQEPIS